MALPTSPHPLESAAHAIMEADAFVLGAGAGMGVDSGLPDFRGPQGFWRAYPAYEQLGLSFSDLANPSWFDEDPTLAWGFYGHRLHLYRDTVPHNGFSLLRDLIQARPSFVYTSNVDGQFQHAGWDEEHVYEIHGSIHWLQCSRTQIRSCTQEPWSAKYVNVSIDESSGRAHGDLPKCPRCKSIARPNILMFGDPYFHQARTSIQAMRYRAWLRTQSRQNAQIVTLEFGAGTTIPSVRQHSKRLLTQHDATLIRINPREPQGPRHTISLPLGAQEAVERIASLIR